MASLDVTADGLVQKTVIVEGDGGLPPLHAKCLVHYTARLADGGELVMDSRAEQRSGTEPALVVAGRTAALRATGLNLGVASMQQGERCKLTVAPEYGYGSEGSFSFPAVPPGAALEYEVEMLQWEAANEEKPRNEMLFEERLEAAERRRIEGNDLFKDADAAAAATVYRMALMFLDEDLLMQLEGPHLTKANNVKLPLHLNLAACDLQLEDWASAVENCDEVLREQPDNAKAIFRRGRARLALGMTDAAEEDLLRASALAPNDAAIRRQLLALKKERSEERQAQRQIFRGSLPTAACATVAPASQCQSLLQRGVSSTHGAVAACAAVLNSAWQILTRLFVALFSWRVSQTRL